MTTFINRANPRQRKVVRMVAGAVNNVVHVHPEWKIDDPRLANSIAKRAAGTLTAGWPDVLATPRVASSEMVVCVDTVGPPPPPHSGSVASSPSRRTASHLTRRRAPLRVVAAAVGRLAGPAKRAGHTARYEALVEALRIIGAEMKKLDEGARPS